MTTEYYNTRKQELLAELEKARTLMLQAPLGLLAQGDKEALQLVEGLFYGIDNLRTAIGELNRAYQEEATKQYD